MNLCVSPCDIACFPGAFQCFFYDVQLIAKNTGGMHRFGSVSLSLPSPALHSTLNRMALRLSFTQIDTHTHTLAHIPLVFVSKDYIGVTPYCLSDLMGASAITTSGSSESFVNSSFLSFQNCVNFLLWLLFSPKVMQGKWCVFVRSVFVTFYFVRVWELGDMQKMSYRPPSA